MNGLILSGAMDGIVIDNVFVLSAEIESETFICDKCGERHLRDYAIEFDGLMWCEECADEETFICDHCGERHYRTSEERVYGRHGDEETWCQDCTDNDARYCDECGNYYDYDYVTYVRGERCVCDWCRDDYYVWCEECEEYVSQDDYDYDAEMCEDCARERGYGEARSDNARVRSYHCPPPMRWFGSPYRILGDSFLYKGIGVELEVDADWGTDANIQNALNCIDEMCGDRVYFEHDGSLNKGFEIITQPHTLEAFSEIPWAEIMQICRENGFSSHDVGTCGLHVHFSREMFGDDTEEQDENITKLVQFIELYFDDMVKVSRRTENQLRWAGKKGTISKKRLKESVKSRSGGHYEAVNNSNAHTVEIRIMRGTLNIETFNASIDLLTTIVKNVCRLDDVTDETDVLEGVSRETLTYLSRQGAFEYAVNRLIYR